MADIFVRDKGDKAVQLAPQTEAALFWLEVWAADDGRSMR